MPGKLLYTQAIPKDSQQDQREEYRRHLAKSGAVDSENAVVEDVSLEPGEEVLRASFRGRHCEVMKEEMRELFESDAHGVVPFFGYDHGSDSHVRTEDDGYYTLESFDVERLDPRFETPGESGQDMYEWTGRIVKEGTIDSHWRAVRYNRRDAYNPFATSGDVHLAVPSDADKVRWFDPVGGAKEFAEPSGTVESEFLDLELYDLAQAPVTEGLLIYIIPYTSEGKADAKAWDTLGETEQADVATDDGHMTYQQWHKVFSTRHEFRGDLVLDNEVLRVIFTQNGTGLEAARYTAGGYEEVTLGTSDWEVFDAELTGASQTADEVQVEFTDGSAFYVLNGRLRRGMENILWETPQNQDGTLPDGLRDLLDPIASERAYKVASSKEVQRRGEVRL